MLLECGQQTKNSDRIKEPFTGKKGVGPGVQGISEIVGTYWAVNQSYQSNWSFKLLLCLEDMNILTLVSGIWQYASPFS